jgi:hypothetical protein
MMSRRLFTLCVFELAALTVRAADPVSYANEVRPILAERCQLCHQESNRGGGLSMVSHASLLAGGTSGAVVVAGNSGQSLLFSVVAGLKPRMPKAGLPLTAGQVALLKRWIEEGAKDDGSAAQGAAVWWSLRPMIKPAVASSSGNPIDFFLRAKLRERKLDYSPEADRRTLIRRVTFDLHGLPPTPEEVDAFLGDKASDAYETLVDRLLASPRYGERWARHWLDVVHYGDSHGYDKDKPRPNAWPYRDYVIRALNQDKPYARFVEEQLAGDVIDPDEADAIAATGFIAAGPWDFVGHEELREGTTDKSITRNLDRDDMVATTMSTFVSQTVHCARCHNHKFDPISQEDYYSVQAVFAGVDRADRPWDADRATARARRGLLAKRREIQVRLQPLLDQMENASSSAIEDLTARMSEARSRITDLKASKSGADADLAKALQARNDEDAKSRKGLVNALVGPLVLSEVDRLTAEAKSIDTEAAALPKPDLVYAAANYFPQAGTFRPALEPRPVFVLNRGDVNSPMKPVQPGAVGIRFEIADSNDEGARRAALAHWITGRDNTLTWRSIVNRVWHYHFGTGIVDSPSDFGRMGSQPTHPELLDWLAVWFRDDAAGSLKKLHRLIVTSEAYRQSSKDRADGAQVDSENRYLWRMNRTRLDAESVHDALLAVSGKLDVTMGGPAARLFWFKDDHSPVYDYARFDPASPEARRRSVYRFIVRSVPDPFMERLDCPDPSMLAPKRGTTITAIQALALLNNPFVVWLSERFGERLVTEGGGRAQDQIRLAYRLAFGREASVEDVRRLADYASRNGIANACRLLFNSNEFVFVD